jgi:hypothetical protein
MVRFEVIFQMSVGRLFYEEHADVQRRSEGEKEPERK